MYTTIDPRTLRAGFVSQQWRPHGTPLAEQMPLEGEITGIEGEKLHTCEIEMKEGSKCGRTFTSLSAL
eukprot:1783650-Pyramimonas_sp.AAC.1